MCRCQDPCNFMQSDPIPKKMCIVQDKCNICYVTEAWALLSKRGFDCDRSFIYFVPNRISPEGYMISVLTS